MTRDFTPISITPSEPARTEVPGVAGFCLNQSTLAFRWIGWWFSRFAPKGNVRQGVRVVSFVAFPFITFVVWFFQAILWFAIAAPVAAYGTVMLLIAFVVSGIVRLRRMFT